MDNHGVLDAAVLGTVAGMRSMVPLAALGLTLPRRRLAGLPVAVGAVAELVYDKLPQAKDRTEPPSLAARMISGALAGGLAARALGESTATGAVTGALAAFASAFLFRRLRAAAAARVPPLTAAVGEDLLAVGLATAALRPLR